MKRLKEYLQKRKSSWPALALTAAVLLFCLVIAFQAGKIGSMFHPESFLSREERKEEFDPKGYGLEEDGEKQKEEDDRQDDTFEQEQTGQRTENPEAEDPAPQAYREDNDRERTGSRQIVYVDRQPGEGIRRQVEGGNPEDPVRPDEEEEGVPEEPDRSEEENRQPTEEPSAPDEEEPDEDPDDDDPDDWPQPDEDPDEWVARDLTISYYRNQDAVSLYKEQTPSESYIRGNITVTSHWENKEDPSRTKTETETAFSMEAIPQEYARKLTDADVNKSFSLEITCQGMKRSVVCVVKDDYIRYTTMRVNYHSSPVYVTGETLFEGDTVNDTPIRSAISLEVYGRTVQGGQEVYLPDESNYRVEFKEQTGGVAAKKEDGSLWQADIVYCGPGEGTTEVLKQTDAVHYDVRDYRLTIMYDENRVLDTIYTDDRTVVLNGTYDGRCPYNEMVERLRENGRYTISEEGYLTDLFYGWSSRYPATARNRKISYTFKEGQHTQVMYAIPLEPLLSEGYLVKTQGDDQVLCGYVPQKESDRLDVPYGVTRVALDKDFQISAQAEEVRTLALSATVNSVDLSAAGRKFPNLSEYSVVSTPEEGGGNVVEENHIFDAQDGLLYSADQSVLWKVPSDCQEFTIAESVQTIAEGALADAAAGCEGGTLSITMEAERPPELRTGDEAPVFGGADCVVRVEVPETADSVVDDLIYKRYLSSWGEIFDEELGESGAAAKSICTEDGAQSRYENQGDTVYSLTDDGKNLAFVSGEEENTYEVPEEAQGIDAYAFAEPGSIQFVHVGENVTHLAKNSFAGLEDSLAGVQIGGGQAIVLEEKIAGDEAPRGMKFYISLAQEEASGWIDRLGEDYGEEAVSRMLTFAEGTLFIDGQGCAYLQKEEGGQALILCSVPEELETYHVPEGYRVVELAAGAFAWCDDLIYVELPDVTRIGENAFYGCGDLEIAVFANPQLEQIGDAFAGCDSLETVVLGNAGADPVLPQQTQLLAGERYFASDRMIYEKKTEDTFAVLNVPTNVTGNISLLDGTREIGSRAFFRCTGLTGIAAAQMNRVKTIGAYAFAGCADLQEALIGEDCRNLGESAFADCENLETVIWLGDTAEVGEAVFAENPRLSTVYFGSDTGTRITSVGSGTFEDCTSLQMVYFEAGVRKIGDACFRNCVNMRTSIAGTYAAACETIGDYAFAGCARYTQTLALYDGLQKLGRGAFLDCTGLNSMWLPPSLTEVPAFCFAGCTGMRSLVVLADSDLVSIGDHAFSGCTALESVTNFNLLTGLRSLGEGVFSEGQEGDRTYAACTMLSAITLPASIEEIGERAFAGCQRLKEVAINQGERLTKMGKAVFKDCAALREGNLSRTGLTLLPEETFAGCSSLETVLLPESMLSLKERALADCSSLTEMSILNRSKVVSVASNVFDGTSEDGGLVIYVPYTDNHELRNSYHLAWDWWSALWNWSFDQTPFTVIKDRVMEEWTFVENGGLYERRMDGSLCLVQAMSVSDGTFTVKEETAEIRADAFHSCEGLSVLVLPDTIKRLPANLFADCEDLEVVCLAAGLRLPAPEGDLFGGKMCGENFAFWTSEEQLTYYESWTSLPVRSYGIEAGVQGGVLYGLEDTGEVVLHYVPRSFAGVLNVSLGTEEVADEAARDCQGLTAVNSTYTVERIGQQAFAGCTSLRTVDFTSLSATCLTEIGDYAFAGCTSLTGETAKREGVFLPSSMERYGKGVFKDCTSLVSLSLQGRASEISDEFCSGCQKLRSLSLSRTLLNAVTRIGDKAFYQCRSITSASWSNMPNLRTVGVSAYEDCSGLIQATFADRLEELEDRAFWGTRLEILSFNGEEPPTLGEDVFDEAGEEHVHVYIPAGQEGETYLRYYEAWEEEYPTLVSRLIAQDGSDYRAVNNILYLVRGENSAELIAIRVPAGAKDAQIYNSSSLYCVRLEDGSFRNCTKLVSLTIPNRVESIGSEVFENCTALETVHVEGSALRTIGEEAFENCASLTALTLPESVYSLGDGMLEECTSFRTLTVKGYAPFSLGKKIFGKNVDEDVRIYVPMAAYEDYLEQWGRQLDKEYGAGAGERILAAVSDDGTKKIENGQHWTWEDGQWTLRDAEENPETENTNSGHPGKGKTDDVKPDNPDADTAQPDGTDTDTAQSGGTDADTAQPDGADTDTAQPDDTDTDVAQPGGTDTDTTQPDDTDTDVAQPGGTDTDTAQPDDTDTDVAQPGGTNTDTVQSGGTDNAQSDDPDTDAVQPNTAGEAAADAAKKTKPIRQSRGGQNNDSGKIRADYQRDRKGAGRKK